MDSAVVVFPERRDEQDFGQAFLGWSLSPGKQCEGEKQIRDEEE